MKNTSQSIIPFVESYHSVTEAVAALAQPQLDRLLAIARRRIERLNQSSTVQRLLGQCDPADFVQDAIMLVLVGELQPGNGRRSHARHLASERAFFNFIQGVIHSRISAHLKKLVNEGEHQQAEVSNLPANRTVVQDVQLNEVKATLCARPRKFAGDNPALQSTLQLLEVEATDTDRQPTRKQLFKMRRLGREVLKEMANGEDVKELFMS